MGVYYLTVGITQMHEGHVLLQQVPFIFPPPANSNPSTNVPTTYHLPDTTFLFQDLICYSVKLEWCGHV